MYHIKFSIQIQNTSTKQSTTFICYSRSGKPDVTKEMFLKTLGIAESQIKSMNSEAFPHRHQLTTIKVEDVEYFDFDLNPQEETNNDIKH